VPGRSWNVLETWGWLIRTMSSKKVFNRHMCMWAPQKNGERQAERTKTLVDWEESRGSHTRLGLGFEANRAEEHMKTSEESPPNCCVLPRDHMLASRTDAERILHRLLDQIGFKSIPLRFFHSIWTRSFCPTLKLYARIHDIFNGNHNGNGIYSWKLENPLLPSSLASFRSRLLLLLFFEFFLQI
jgi:hypothetical protein